MDTTDRCRGSLSLLSSLDAVDDLHPERALYFVRISSRCPCEGGDLTFGEIGETGHWWGVHKVLPHGGGGSRGMPGLSQQADGGQPYTRGDQARLLAVIDCVIV